MAREIMKKDKICLVCGITFKGIASAQTCTPACRTALLRIKNAGKRPEYIQMAKGKGQKIPDLNAPKRLKFKKGEKKQKPELLESGIIFAAPTPESYDGPPTSSFILDEVGAMPHTPSPMTKEQIFAYNLEINKQIEAIRKEPLPPGMLVRAHTLNKETRIDNLQKLLK
ncbi:MAG TPA: hypothetical protein PKV73_01390 [Agriterribacter sp.]|nr:hypothetical protein [Agriterribacter sp.]